jgi:hypothetical protein
MAKKKPEESRREFNVAEQVRVKLRTGETFLMENLRKRLASKAHLHYEN